MVTKQNGSIYSLVVSDVYGVILCDGQINTAYLQVLQKLSSDRTIVAYTSLSQHLIRKLKDHSQLSMISRFYSASSSEWPKHQPESYRILARQERVSSGDIIFIDDSPLNVEASVEAGCAGIVYSSTTRLIKQLNQLGLRV